MCGNGGGKCAAGPMGVRGLDEFSFENLKKPSVVQQVGGPLGKQMSALDQHILAAKAVDHLGRAPRIGQ